MNSSIYALTAQKIFDGTRFHTRAAIGIDAGQVCAIWPSVDARPTGVDLHDLGDGILAPGLVDLQVNGGGGVMVGAGTDTACLRRICDAHARLGASTILPTLITDTDAVTRQVIAACIAALDSGVAGLAGLHLEGPHLDPARKGAHDTALIRPMTEDDVTLLLDTAQKLPALMVTIAPEAVTPDQIARLAAAGVIISLGHSGCSAERAHAAASAGARCVTHLYNAMGPLQNRAPGLVGAALCSDLAAGLIVDDVHVARECVLIALKMKPWDKLFLVSDAMAVAGTNLGSFQLGRRKVYRADGQLTLADGTLAGADISLPRGLALLVSMGVAPERALAMASRIPADIIGATDRGRIEPGARADFVLLDNDMSLRHVWRGGDSVI